MLPSISGYGSVPGGAGGGHGGNGGRGGGNTRVGLGYDSMYQPVMYGSPGGFGSQVSNSWPDI